jgi:hypothetical protein
MTTALSLIDKALGALGVLDEGGTANSAQQTLCLSLLNGMIDRWSSERLSVPIIAQVTKTLSANDGAYTVGSGADISITKPLRVMDSSFIRYSNQDYELRNLARNQYQAITDKSSIGLPVAMFYDAQHPTATLYLWPVPDQSYVLYLDYWSPLSSFSLVSTDINLPPAAESALWQNLAKEAWPFYPNPQMLVPVSSMANMSKSSLQKTNVTVPILDGTFREERYDAISDTGA